jgi:hypothetical protein
MMTDSRNYIRDPVNRVRCAITPSEFNEVDDLDRQHGRPEGTSRRMINDYSEFGGDPKRTKQLMLSGCPIQPW